MSIPTSNVAGNNQTSPGLSAQPKPIMVPGTNNNTAVPINNTLTPGDAALNNPYVPPVSGNNIPTTSGTMGTTGGYNQGAANGSSASQGFITNNLSNTDGNNNLLNQETDIYGQGVGASIFSLLNNMSGTNSTILQEYEQSLQPQEAQAQANLMASLGAGGVSANSSVAALGEANLGAQENAMVAGEAANLTQSQENLTAQILTGQEQAATSEVASSGWDVFGQVAGAIGSVAGDVLGAAGDAGGFSHLFS